MKYITPEYLLSHGFVQYNSIAEGDVYEIPFYDEHAMHFREVEFNRQMFVVVLWPSDGILSATEYDHSIYVQEDAGCGFVQIPEAWCELPVDYFEAIYYGIRGDKPIKQK
jgi:hypothetical protein